MNEVRRRNRTRMVWLTASSFFVLTMGAQLSNAQITNAVKANIGHRFTVGNATLPPGHYTFRMLQGSDMTAMTVTSADGNTSADFLVREATAPSTPKHAELVFDRYGTHEFLAKVFEGNSKIGEAVVEPSREEQRLQKQGQHPVEHTEEQQP